ncbi:MAG: NHL repeat-containing protein [Armatimonadetes bacterium]|nr:NHL repeat-containing protein [Armatimonadota bacterium]
MRTWLRYFAAVCIAGTLTSLGGCPALAEEVKLSYSFAAYGFSSSQRFSKPSGVFYDASRGELYVADTGNGQIVILDKKGIGIAKIPHSVIDAASGDRRPGEPRSVAVRKNGDILVADNQCSYLDVLDFRGHSIQKIWPGDLVGQPKSKVQTRCVAVDTAGNVYLGVSGCDTEILILTPDLKLKTKIGVESTGESKSMTGLWVDKYGRVFATYGLGVCVRAYAPDGKQLLSFGAHETGPENFSLPSGLITDEKGRLWVVDMLRDIVSVFRLDPSDTGLKQSFVTFAIGGFGQKAGDLAYPSGIAGDGANRIYVVESTGARVQAFEIVSGPDSRKSN